MIASTPMRMDARLLDTTTPPISEKDCNTPRRPFVNHSVALALSGKTREVSALAAMLTSPPMIVASFMVITALVSATSIPGV